MVKQNKNFSINVYFGSLRSSKGYINSSLIVKVLFLLIKVAELMGVKQNRVLILIYNILLIGNNKIRNIKINKYDFVYSKDEINILKKISEWPKCIDASSNKLEPHRIPTYLFELSSLFHSYWNLGKDNPDKRFINNQKKIKDDKLIFLKAISNILKSGMDIVGVSVPEKM